MIKLNKATLIMKAIRLSMININVTTKNQDRCNKIEIKTITNLEWKKRMILKNQDKCFNRNDMKNPKQRLNQKHKDRNLKWRD